MYIVLFFNHVPLIIDAPQSSADFFAPQVEPSLVWEQIYKA